MILYGFSCVIALAIYVVGTVGQTQKGLARSPVWAVFIQKRNQKAVDTGPKVGSISCTDWLLN